VGFHFPAIAALGLCISNVTEEPQHRLLWYGHALVHEAVLSLVAKGTTPAAITTVCQAIASIAADPPGRSFFGVTLVQSLAQLVHKAEILKETLSRIGKLAFDETPAVIPSPSPYGYRNSVRLAVFRDGKTFRLGFHRQGTTEPVAAAGCLLVPPALGKTVIAVNERLAAQSRLPLRLESVEFRHSLAFDSTLLIYRTGPATTDMLPPVFALGRAVPHAESNVVGQVVMARQGQRWQRFVEGQDWIADRLNDLIFRISDRSFFQANWALNEILSRAVCDWVGSPSGIAPHGFRVLELYSGIGTLGLPLARQGALVTEVEANPYALADARHAAKANHIGRMRFRPLRAESMLEAVQPGEYDVVTVAPPRTGLSPECVQSLVRIQPPRLLYLSSDAPTLARDLSRLCADGYRIARLQPFDMFPQTAHLETLVELAR
jgi:23S rRNA (uracil1939-C5)-methyltransferase